MRSCEFTDSLLSGIQNGVMKTFYKDIPFYKSPFDIGIYLQLLSKLKPKTIVEIVTKHGGSSLWLADMLSALNEYNPLIISIDIEQCASIDDKRIKFLKGDVRNLSAVLPDEFIAQLQRPLLVVEDSSHYYQHSMACLKFFHNYLQSGDYIVIEDGIISQLPEQHYKQYKDGPNRAIADFLSQHENSYIIDIQLCDHYGKNITYNPNGYLKRI